jgi:hypothetical protein
MSQNYEKLFAKIKPNEPFPGLLETVVNRIEKERGISIRRRIFIFTASAIFSVIAFIPAFQSVHSEFVDSGFTRFFSLLFSDFEIVVAYWQSFAMSLLETLPIMGLLVLTSVSLIFLESMRLLVKNINIITSSKKLVKT